MEVLGVGPLELFFILIIALIFLGPRDMVKAGRTLGKMMRQIVMSPTWRMVQQTSRELRTLPNRMIREAGMEEDLKDLDKLNKDVVEQIGSLRKPFSAAVNDANKELYEAQASPKPPLQPPVLGGLSAWTTPPPEVEHPDQPTIETDHQNQSGNESEAGETSPDNTSGAIETSNPN